MKLNISINCDNAAFAEDIPTEVDLILQNYVEKLLAKGMTLDSYNLRDTNGNTVGHAKFEDEPEDEDISLKLNKAEWFTIMSQLANEPLSPEGKELLLSSGKKITNQLINNLSK